MTNVSEWSPTAGLNVNSPPDGWPEGMARSAVNDTAREMMGALARWYQDSNASLLSTGGTTAYTLTTNSGHTALTDIPLLVFRVNVTNTGTVTLAVDGLGAKPWRKSANGDNYLTGELVSGRVVVVAYNSGDDDFYTVGPTSRGEIAGGGVNYMFFWQTTPPTGWTKYTGSNNVALRLVSGSVSSGGSTPFTSVFTSRTITHGNLPNPTLTVSGVAFDHVHGVNINSGTISSDHVHSYTKNQSEVDNITGGGGNQDMLQDTESAFTGGVSSNHIHNVSGNTGGSNYGNLPISATVALGGSGTAMDFAVQYVDIIAASKD